MTKDPRHPHESCGPLSCFSPFFFGDCVERSSFKRSFQMIIFKDCVDYGEVTGVCVWSAGEFTLTSVFDSASGLHLALRTPAWYTPPPAAAADVGGGGDGGGGGGDGGGEMLAAARAQRGRKAMRRAATKVLALRGRLRCRPPPPPWPFVLTCYCLARWRSPGC